MPSSAKAGGDDAALVVTAAYTSGPADETFVRTVGYSTGESHRKLEWSPVRPTKDQIGARRQAVHAAQRQSPPGTDGQRTDGQHAERVPSVAERVPLVAEPIPTPQAVDPFDDPFGDSMGLSQLAPPANLPGDRLLEKPQPKPTFLAAPPNLLDAESSEQSQPIEVPSLEESLAAGPGLAAGECPKPEDLKRIREITWDIKAGEGRFPRECPLGSAAFQPRCWRPTTFTWTASALCHKPLYFEDVQLERYGHSWGPYLQPLVSGAHFFLAVPILPYQMGLYPPGECMYSLGYYRPGNCAPYLLDPLPISIRAGLAEAGAWVGLAAAIP